MMLEFVFLFSAFLFFKSSGGSQNIRPIKENISPPIDPAAKANQKGSFDWYRIKGDKPKMVEVIVNNIGTILFEYALR